MPARPRSVRAAYVAFLRARLDGSRVPGSRAGGGVKPYQYVVLRCVPRVEREEFVNVGVVLYCQAAEFLDVGWHVDRGRLAALDPGRRRRRGLRRAGLRRAPSAAADESAGSVASKDRGTRFGFLRAPRSTVVQPGPVHGGLTDDPSVELQHLLDTLVR